MAVFMMRHADFGNNYQSHVDEINRIKHIVFDHILKLYPRSVFSIRYPDTGTNFSTRQYLTAYYIDLPLMNSSSIAPDSRLIRYKNQLPEFYDSPGAPNDDDEGMHVIAIANQTDLKHFNPDVSWKFCTLWSKEDGVIYPGHLPTRRIY
jgi:hypothetical protein